MNDPVRPAEGRLIALLPQFAGRRLLCNSAGRGQLARAFAEQSDEHAAVCLFQDLFQQRQANLPAAPPRATMLCAADPPEESFDVAALCVSKQGEAELTRDQLQAFYQRLTEGGKLLAAVDNGTDQWLHEQMRALFPKVTQLPEKKSTAYIGIKKGPSPKFKEFSSEFPFRDGERLFTLRTRPGVFSHRHVDPGARALLEVTSIEPSERLLDLGCGAGTVGVALGLRAEGVSVLAVDSAPRAIECATWAAEKNGLPKWEARLDCDGTTVPAGQFDLVATNPPYYSNFRISELLLRTATKALRKGGRLAVVTKTPDWYLENLPQMGFGELMDFSVRSYHVLTAVRG